MIFLYVCISTATKCFYIRKIRFTTSPFFIRGRITR
ncbi:unnamed protein product [Larinioides sclopetarius]|uniref:Uncharacterized protein n=1 Tax=Larinioides sclopetarius TaxID=280406 RepID=A0AAV2AVZ6_9ARAC